MSSEENGEDVAIRGRDMMKVAHYMKEAKKKAAARKAKRKRRKKKIAEHRGLNWFAIERMLDPTDIEAVPIRDSGYMLGTIDDMLLIEYPDNIPTQKIRQIGTAFAAMGVKCLMVPKGIRFLQLRGCTQEEEQRLNEIAAKQEDSLKKMIEEKLNAEDGTDGAA